MLFLRGSLLALPPGFWDQLCIQVWGEVSIPASVSFAGKGGAGRGPRLAGVGERLERLRSQEENELGSGQSWKIPGFWGSSSAQLGRLAPVHQGHGTSGARRRGDEKHRAMDLELDSERQQNTAVPSSGMGAK